MASTETLEVPAHVPPELVRDFDFVTDLHTGDDLHRNALKLHDGPDIFYTPRQGGHWVVTRYADAERIVKNFADFTNDNMSIPKIENPYRLIPTESNPPLHSDYRGVIFPYFTPKKIGDLERRAREISTDLLDEIVPRGECEFVSEFALRMPIGIFMSLVDLPDSDRELLIPYVNDYVGGETLEAKYAGFARLQDYMAERIAQRRHNLGDDMLSTIIEAKVEGSRRLTDGEILGFAVLVMIGGLETVAGAMGMIATYLARNPDVRHRLAAEPDEIKEAMEELLRRYAPVMFARTVGRDLDHDGIQMKQGDLVLILPAAINLDERRYDDPLTIDFHRPNKRHFSFGAGIHTCIGSFLARTELRVFVVEWLKRIPEFPDQAGHRAGDRHGLQPFDDAAVSRMGSGAVTTHVCPYCGYTYHEEAGDPSHGAPPGTAWDGLPPDWECPDCGAERQSFIIE